MKCAWAQLLAILPVWMRSEVDTCGKDTLEELRLRLGYPPELVCHRRNICLQEKVSQKDLHFVVNTASQYSPWAAETLASGFITAPGGHRIGVAGEAVTKSGLMTGVRSFRSLCIRVCRDFTGLFTAPVDILGSVLIIGKPGSGKTTLLRDLIRLRSEKGRGSIAVVDERGEIFPPSSDFCSGSRTDVLTGVSKTQGIEMLLRTMGPETIAVDEITSQRDCDALIHSAWCGVSLLATAHASSRKDLLERKVYQPLVNSGVFDTLITLNMDKSWRAERMVL